ncbi:MAG: ROK family protein [Propionibacteriaceae bacterium]|jgi:predicted NBD/HSP70 family sugar kinase|nr:ROK family protein [Propionibacteriaceae bacterium]
MDVNDKNKTESLPLARLRPPALVRLTDQSVAMSVVARLVASGTANTRPALVKATGLARSTVSSCVSLLQARGLVVSHAAQAALGRGRPAETLAINPDAGTILVFDLTPHHVRVALTRMDQQLLANRRAHFVLDAGPEATLAFAISQARTILDELGPDGAAVRAVVTSVPGPVDTKRGMPVRPPIMPGWDRYPIADTLQREFGCPCLVDNDVNLIALGEASVLPADQCPMLVVKVGTGIGGGLITAEGSLHHGADGAACDIGHLPVRSNAEMICSCGNINCIEALASAEAITRRFREATGNPELTQSDLRAAARVGDPLAIRVIRDAAAVLGEIVAALVHVYNPARIVITGPLTAVTDDLLAGVRSVAYQRALPLATRNLTLAHSEIGEMAGVVGAVVLGIEAILAPASFSANRPGEVGAANFQ